MTAATATIDAVAPAKPVRQSGHAVADAITVTWRNLKAMSRTPEVIVFSTIQPIIFVIIFRYVFGGAFKQGNVDYIDFLMPGVFVQTVAFGATNTAVGLAQDLQTGIIERFRSLPMARSAVLAGRTLADLVRNLGVVVLMFLVGTLVGFRVHTNFFALLAAIGVVLLFAFAFSWVFALIGLATSNAEAAQAATFPLLALLVFASSAFVPTDTMPGWLQVYTEHQPVSDTVEAVRLLVVGGPTAEAVLTALAWSIGILVVFAPIAVSHYRKAA